MLKFTVSHSSLIQLHLVPDTLKGHIQFMPPMLYFLTTVSYSASQLAACEADLLEA